MSDRLAMKKQVDALRYQLDVDRMPASKTIADLLKYVEENEQTDPFIATIDKKHNPWAEKSKCSIL